MFIVEESAMLAERYIDKKVFPRYFLINFKSIDEVKGAQSVDTGIWKILDISSKNK